MELLCHYSLPVFSNTYILGKKEGGDAVIIDPGAVDVSLINMIENKGFYIKSILITHSHENHIRGVKTLLKIYDAQIYANSPFVYSIQTQRLFENRIHTISGFPVEVFEIQGHSSDSLVYRIENLLFTGDVFFSGRIGSTPNSYAKNLLINSIIKKICLLPDQTLIFPGHGPPTTLEAEKKFNPYFIS